MATNEAKAIVSDAKILEWVSLEKNLGSGSKGYDDQNYVSLKFEADTKTGHSRYTNIKIQVFGSPSSMNTMAAEDFGYKMHSDISAKRGIFQLIRGGNIQFTNKYMAIELGTAVNDRLMKVGLGATPSDAQEDLNRQTLWNYMDKKMAEADDRIVQEAINRGSSIWVSYLLNPVTGDNTDNPAYSSKTVTNIVFNSTNKTVKLEYITTVGQNTSTKENVYGYTMIEDNSITNGVFRLTGYGDFGDKFVAGELIGSDNTYTNRGRIAIGKDTEEAKTLLQSTNSLQQWNMLERNSLLLNARVINTAVSKGVLAGLDSRNLHDPQSTTNLQFTQNGIDMKLIYTEYINGVPRPTEYEIEMVNDISAEQGIFLLKGTGMFRNQYARIHFSGTDKNEVTFLIKPNQDDLTNDSIMTSSQDVTKYKVKTELQQDRGLIDTIITQQPFVTLSDKKVYVPKTSGNISFAKTVSSALIAERVTMTVITNDTSYIYDVLQVSNDTVNNQEGTYFLKGSTSSPLNNKYLLLKVDSLINNNIVNLRVGIGDDMTAMSNDFNDDGIAAGYTVKEMNNAKWVRRSQFASDEVLLELVRESPSISIVRGGFNDPRDTDQWTFDIPNRKITIKKGNTFSSGNLAGQQVANDEYYFYIYTNDTSNLEVGIVMNSFPSTVDSNRQVAQYSYFKLSSELSRKNNFFSMNYSFQQSGAKNEALVQH